MARNGDRKGNRIETLGSHGIIHASNCDDKILCDLDDLPILQGYTWHTAPGKKTRYAFTNIRQPNGTRKGVKMHRLILDAPNSVGTDHKNRDGLDNRRSNLRFATGSQNSANRGIDRRNTSGFRGVSWHKRQQKWNSYIKVQGKKLYLGTFEAPIDAARAYNDAAKYHFGEFAFQNPLPDPSVSAP